MRVYTLAFFFKEGKILLAMKKRSFGVGKWNGYGGKLEEGETPIIAIVREVKEESNLDVPPEAFLELGFINFYFDDKPEWNQRVVIYRVDDFEGEPKETEEMHPQWFDLGHLPYGQMWAGDDRWLPFVIEKKNFSGEVHFSNKGETLLSAKFD